MWGSPQRPPHPRATPTPPGAGVARILRYTPGVFAIPIVNVGVGLACVLLLGFGFVLEHYEGLPPCPLCILQRAVFVLLALIVFVAAVHRPRTRGGGGVYGVLAGSAAALGAGIAGWQVWLQSLPPEEAPECGPGLEYMLDAFPLLDTLEMIFTGSGECAEVVWTFLSISIPGWSLLWFVALGLVSLVNNFRRPVRESPLRLFR